MPTRVDFYVLPAAEEHARLQLACRLVDKAYRAQHRVCVRLGSDSEAQALDDLLWTFADGSFIPHGLAPGDAATPVVIGGPDIDPDPGHDLLVNLAASLPGDVSRYARILEIVNGDSARKAEGRERFRQYRELGIEPETHKIAGNP